MPALSNASAARPWRESWPPTQLRLQQPGEQSHAATAASAVAKDEHHDEMELVDNNNPLVYFLTPTPLLATDEDGESYYTDDLDACSYFYDDLDGADDSAFCAAAMDFEFDAGIEDATHPQLIVRSVSPSSLADSLGGRVSRAAMRPPTPPKARHVLHPDGRKDSQNDDDDDGGADCMEVPSARGKPATPASRLGQHHSAWSPPSPLPSSPASSRSVSDIHDLYAHHYAGSSAGHLTAAGAMIVRRRSPRSWRVPSPDVFSIEEETEEELSAGAAADWPGRSGYRHHQRRPHQYVQGEDTAAKPLKKKQVRFVLPGEVA